MRRTVPLLAALAALVPSAPHAVAQISGSGALADLARPRDGKIVHASSNDPTGGNGDLRAVEPGQSLTLLDYRGGPGAVRRWWITIAPRNSVEIQRQCIVRCYWDGEKDPSVEVPVSDFFGMGFGEWRDFQSAPLNMTSGGYNCYWPMPFRKSARIVIENRSKVRIDAFYYNIDVLTQKKAPKDLLYFHAQFRRTRTRQGEPVTLLDAVGRGHYVGTLLSMQFVTGRGLFYLEGDEQVSIDGEKVPSILGTGTEDYFSSGWYYDTGAYSALYHGVPIKDEASGRISTYRWHIEDPIPFRKSLHFQIEHGGRNDVPPADYTSVAFWYQTHPRAPFPPLPRDLMPLPIPPIPKIAGIIEGESLVPGAKATEGGVSLQDMGVWDGMWSNYGQLWWRPTSVGARLKLTLESAAARDGVLAGYFTVARDYGNARVWVNGVPVGDIQTFYSPDVKPTGKIVLGNVHLNPGKNELMVEIVGKDPRSSGYLIGIDGFTIE